MLKIPLGEVAPAPEATPTTQPSPLGGVHGGATTTTATPGAGGCGGAHVDVSDSAGGQGARAAACALRVQSMLGTEASGHASGVVASSASSASCMASPAGAAAAITTPTSVEANMRFSQNLHALELNLANLEQSGEALPDRPSSDRALPVRRVGGGNNNGCTPPFSSPFSPACSSPAVPLTSPLNASNYNVAVAEAAGVMHKPHGAHSPWVETRRKRSVAPQVPTAVSE